MPEGDTVFRTAARLHQALAGKPFDHADLRWPDLSTLDFRGVPTLEVVSRGKNILQRLGNGVTLHSHLRMEGQWRVDATDRLTARTSRTRRSGARGRRPPGPPLGHRLGDAEPRRNRRRGPPGRSPRARRARSRLGPRRSRPTGPRRPRATIGAALLDQRNLAGVGTLYAAETLFLERVRPWTLAGRSDPATVAAVVDRAHRLLDLGRRHAVQTTTGSRAGARPHRYTRRSGRPCRRCGETVRVALVGEAASGADDVLLPAVPGRPGPHRRRSTAASARNGQAQRPRARRPRAPSLTSSRRP